MTPRHQHGFSLVELMVAMTITLIVSAAIYGLLTSGSNAFRREPELADRQQNIRVAMDLIARDVFNAGAGLPPFSQVFTRSDPTGGACTGDNGLNGCGVPGTVGGAQAPGDGGDPSANTDVLELVASDEQCPVLHVCASDPADTKPGTAGTFMTLEGLPRCMRLPGLALLTDNTSFVVQPAQAVIPAAKACPNNTTSAQQNGNLLLGLLGDATFRPPAALMGAPPGSPTFLYLGRIVRYRIGPGLDPGAPATPALWRSETGRYTATGQLGLAEPGDPTFAGSGSQWEIVARGIEDLQIEYMPGDGAWHNRPPASVMSPAPQNWQSIVRQVRITLSARAAAPNLAGQTSAGGAPPAVRGQLTTTVTPRAAFNELQIGSQIE